MKNIKYIALVCVFFSLMYTGPIHYFFNPQDEDEFFFFSDEKTTDKKMASTELKEEEEQETVKNDAHSDSDETEEQHS